MTTTSALAMDTFTVSEEIQVNASLEDTFDSLITQIGRHNETPDGKPLPMMLEAHPGGRWYRDLGGDNGHLWAYVQSIKRPVLLEFWGPLFMSTGATSNMQYRLSEKDGGTLIDFTHTVVGPFPEEHRTPLSTGWKAMHARVKRAAEAAANVTGEPQMRIIDCSPNSNRKPQRRAACSNACRRSTLSWRPHPKSMSLGQLALHVATMPGNVAAARATGRVVRAAGVRAA